MQTFMSMAIDITVKISVLLLVTFLLTVILRRSSAAVRHRLWCLAFCGALAVPFLSAVIPHYRIAVLPARSADTNDLDSTSEPMDRPVFGKRRGDALLHSVDNDRTQNSLQTVAGVWDPSDYEPLLPSAADSDRSADALSPNFGASYRSIM